MRPKNIALPPEDQAADKHFSGIMSTDRENVMGKGPIWDRENVTPPSLP